MAFQGFGKDSGPATPPTARIPFGQFPRPPSPSPPPPVSPRSSVDYRDLGVPMRPMTFEHGVTSGDSFQSYPRMQNGPQLRWSDTKESSSRNYNPQSYQQPARLRPNNSTGLPGKSAEMHYIRRTTSPYSKYPDEISRNSRIVIESRSDLPSSNRSPLVPYQARSPPQLPQNNLYVGGQQPRGNVQQKHPSPVWGHQSDLANNNITPESKGAMPSVSPTRGTYQSGQMFQTNHAGAPPPKRTRSPTLSPTSVASSENVVFPLDNHKRSVIDYRDLDAPEAMPSPPLAFESSFSGGGSARPFAGTHKPMPSSMWVNQSISSSNVSTHRLQEEVPSASTAPVTYQSGRSLQADADVGIPNRSRSPTPPNRGALPQNPVFASDGHKRTPHSQNRRDSSMPGQTNGVEVAEDTSLHFPAVKRTKLPYVSSSDPVSREIVDSTNELDLERESQAKAKRLARFKDELSQPMESYSTTRNQKVPVKRQHQSAFDRQRFSEDSSMDVNGDMAGANVSTEYEGMTSSSSIIGLCPDMCPESERAERERKGDLDQYERLDGDRNLTTELLAVKKYNRTAEREAELIRPMPILQKTMDYLLNLLDQPYDDRFLGLYNFLWDRMRAVRMDLRMQHIFNKEAITMLEQMIRLHIIAMHELCEYTKGEGFSEGFDAHLNIEQMNKTSVELFQLYDDHRKKGMEVPSEREFRGYYALLKLDKHPGYKVEPAELSLDLAKMTPEMRQTSEVLFARDVARACRTGNFIAFFRLARKASYLQACLMHAHFSKLRTQALASLYSGLQINQGIPITCVSKWLGMEEEDIDNLLEYYGFVVKDFEEPYMVKENTFINVDKDFPVNRSKLVEEKRSRMIISDVSSPSLPSSYAIGGVKSFQVNKDPEFNPVSLQFTVPAISTEARDQEMLDSDTIETPKVKILSPKGNVQEPMHNTSLNSMTPVEEVLGNESQVALSGPLVLDFSSDSTEHFQSGVASVKKPKYDPVFRNSFGRITKHDPEAISPMTLETAEQKSAPDMVLDSAANTPISQPMFAEDLGDEERMITSEEGKTDEATTKYFDKEIAEAKLKLILRIWKRRAAKKRELRKHKQLGANAALNLLSLGPPIRQYEVGPATLGNNGVLNIDNVVSMRHDILERSWSVVNPSDVVATILAEKNPDAKCLCWKIVLCSSEETPRGDNAGLQNDATSSAARSWVLPKLFPPHNDDYHDLLVSSPGLAIWKSWIPSQSDDDLTCCLSVIRSTTFEDPDKAITGASSILFLLSENIPVKLQKNRLLDLIMSVPSGSCLPLLILSGTGKDESDPSTIAEDLKLHDLDNSRVSMFYITFLKDQKTKNLDGLFSSEYLRGGLEWLASSSPPQTAVCQMKTRELVRSHLGSTLNALDEMNLHRVGPNDCVSAFNEALDRSMRDVAAAAHANPTGWPCPEISLLEESMDEYRAAVWYLPSIGWSSPARTEALMSVLNDSKLPTFKDDVSWLSRGVNYRDDIENQKIYLENCLINYLADTHLMMGVSLAQKEANVMLQSFAWLELHNATFYIIPDWVAIFRRIFSWRMMNFTSADVSSTYVLVQHRLSSQGSEIMDNSKSEVSTYMPPHIVHPSLDELVAVSYNPHQVESLNVENEAFQHRPEVDSSGVDDPTSDVNAISMENGEKIVENVNSTIYDHSMTGANNGGRMIATKATGEADKLSKLLEKCNIVQNLIDKKLSIYF